MFLYFFLSLFLFFFYFLSFLSFIFPARGAPEATRKKEIDPRCLAIEAEEYEILSFDRLHEAIKLLMEADRRKAKRAARRLAGELDESSTDEDPGDDDYAPPSWARTTP